MLIFPASYTDYKIGVEQPGKYKVRHPGQTSNLRLVEIYRHILIPFVGFQKYNHHNFQVVLNSDAREFGGLGRIDEAVCLPRAARAFCSSLVAGRALHLARAVQQQVSRQRQPSTRLLAIGVKVPVLAADCIAGRTR